MSENHRAEGRALIGWLQKAFIGAAFLNFLVGASLGGWMAAEPTAWSMVGDIHGEINPFGWLTMLIYGMTYAVLSISAGLHPPKAWVGWLHFVLAEFGVVVITAAFITESRLLHQVGLACQFAAPVVFLINILSAVFSARRMRSHEPMGTKHEDVEPSGVQQSALAFLRRGSAYQRTDRVGQRGTDVSLMFFIIGTGWMLLNSLAKLNDVTPTAALYLAYYGWIAGTVLAVSLHLLPRFVGMPNGGTKATEFGQIIWGLSVFMGSIGAAWSPMIANFAYRALGIAFVLYSASFLTALVTRRKRMTQNLSLPRASVVAYYASWIYCFILGALLIYGLNPLSLAAIHLLFLAFATSLVYGIAYTLFPLLLSRTIQSDTLPIIQVVVGLLGVSLMVIAFLGLLGSVLSSTALLAIGGALAAASTIVFLVQWMCSTPAVTKNTSNANHE